MTADGVQRVSSGGQWEEAFGYSRAIAVGDFVFVSGCTGFVEGVLVGEGNPFEQAQAAFGIAEQALGELGLTRDDVVRTRMYITHKRDADSVGRAHKEFFDEVRPAATMVVVSALIDSRMLVEVEVEAYRGAK
ncbi:MAG TPA: RidA family protein [Yinghuangia sp.]|uniref:RidA family protein n=1 Tax=Yinghuangia sp. YIM S10712 TaxID=3436930 RepID=UPI002CFBAC13|nr:RidA family protein [Yinghuangia sp.]